MVSSVPRKLSLGRNHKSRNLMDWEEREGRGESEEGGIKGWGPIRSMGGNASSRRVWRGKQGSMGASTGKGKERWELFEKE